MITFLKIFFGCKGTWFWACRQMQEGKTVYRLRDSGVVYFTYDKGRRKIKAMIDWGGPEAETEWGISMEDVFTTDFMLLTEHTNYEVLHRQTQMKCDSKSLTASQLKKHLKPIGSPKNKTVKVNKIGCFATVTGNSTNHRFAIGAMVVVMSQNGTYAYVKGSGGSLGDNILITELKDDTQ